MKFKLEYQLKNGDVLSTAELPSQDIEGMGDFLSLNLRGKENNQSITVNTSEGEVLNTNFSEVESVKIVFID